MTLQGQRAVLLGNPPKRKSGNGTGDEFDGTAIAVSPGVGEYHAMGSLIPRGAHVDGKIRPEGAIWVHIYHRTSFGNKRTFKYDRSVVFEDDKGTNEKQEGRDQEMFDKLVGGGR